MRGKPKVTRKCQYCKKEFKIHYCLAQKGLGKYCSVKCSNNYRNKNILNKLNTNKNTKLVECKACGKSHRVCLAVIKRGGGIYCSKKCMEKYVLKNKLKNKKPCICKKCHKKFYVKKSAFKRKDKAKRSGIFCSKKCMDASRMKRKIIKCKRCKKEISVCTGTKTPRIFCSRICCIKYGASSSLETLIGGQLRKIKCKFVPQKYIKMNKIGTHPDFFIKPNICLYVDGDYWHSFPDTKKRDKRNNRLLKKHKYRVVRIKESLIKKGVKFYMPILKSIKKLSTLAK